MKSIEELRREIQTLISQIDRLSENQEQNTKVERKTPSKTAKGLENELAVLSARIRLVSKQYLRSIFGKHRENL